MDLSSSSVFEWGTLGRPLTYLILEAALFFVLTLCLDAYGRRGHAVTMPAGLQVLLVRWGLHHAQQIVCIFSQNLLTQEGSLHPSPSSIRAPACEHIC